MTSSSIWKPAGCRNRCGGNAVAWPKRGFTGVKRNLAEMPAIYRPAKVVA